MSDEKQTQEFYEIPVKDAALMVSNIAHTLDYYIEGIESLAKLLTSSAVHTTPLIVSCRKDFLSAIKRYAKRGGELYLAGRSLVKYGEPRYIYLPPNFVTLTTNPTPEQEAEARADLEKRENIKLFQDNITELERRLLKISELVSYVEAEYGV